MVLARIVTYNVLSSHLSSPGYYKTCKPQDLDPPTRLDRVLNKLKAEVDKDSIVCLQEVSLLWSGPLFKFFEKHDFTFVPALYGKDYNGYMGVGIAFPRKKYELSDVQVSRVSETKSWPKSADKVQSPLNAIMSLLQRCKRWAMWPVKFVLGCFAKRPASSLIPRKLEDPWILSERRNNWMINLQLKSKQDGSRFCIGTYHMPCVFWDPRVMMIHAALCVQCLENFAGDLEYVLAGDFNFLPGSAPYRLITEGHVDPSDPAVPEPRKGDDWAPTIKRSMKSAYVAANGEEPEVTNYAEPGSNGLFFGAIDFIFASKGVKVKGCLPLKSKVELNGPLPTETEPSDHVLIAADVDIA